MTVPHLHVLGHLPWFAWVAIIAIVCSAVGRVIQARYRHLERIEMIRQGMNPDAHDEFAKPVTDRDL